MSAVITYEDRSNVAGLDRLYDGIRGLLSEDINMPDSTYRALSQVRDRIDYRRGQLRRKPAVTLRQIAVATAFVEARW